MKDGLHKPFKCVASDKFLDFRKQIHSYMAMNATSVQWDEKAAKVIKSFDSLLHMNNAEWDIVDLAIIRKWISLRCQYASGLHIEAVPNGCWPRNCIQHPRWNDVEGRGEMDIRGTSRVSYKYRILKNTQSKLRIWKLFRKKVRRLFVSHTYHSNVWDEEITFNIFIILKRIRIAGSPHLRSCARSRPISALQEEQALKNNRSAVARGPLYNYRSLRVWVLQPLYLLTMSAFIFLHG